MQLDDIAQQLTAIWREHGYQIIIGLLSVTALTLLFTLWRARRKGHAERWVSNVAGVAVLALSAEGMWVVAREQLHLPVVLAATVFFVFEALMLSSAMQAAAQYRRTTERDETGAIVKTGHPGKHGTAVWIIAAAAGVIVSLNSKSVVELVLRLALPLMAALMWWNALTSEGTSRPQGSWRWTPRRLLVAIGALEPTERDLETVDRDRRIAVMTLTAHRVHRGAWPTGWHRGRLVRLALNADDAVIRAVRARVARAHDVVELTAPRAQRAGGSAPSAVETGAQSAQESLSAPRADARIEAPEQRAQSTETAAPRARTAARGGIEAAGWVAFCALREQGVDEPTGSQIASALGGDPEPNPGSVRRYLPTWRHRYAAGERHEAEASAADAASLRAVG